MFIDKLFFFSNLCISLHLNPFGKMNSPMFNLLKFSLYFETLLGFFSQGYSLAKIDQMKQFLSFLIINIADDLERAVTRRTV